MAADDLAQGLVGRVDELQQGEAPALRARGSEPASSIMSTSAAPNSRCAGTPS